MGFTIVDGEFHTAQADIEIRVEMITTYMDCYVVALNNTLDSAITGQDAIVPKIVALRDKAAPLAEELRRLGQIVSDLCPQYAQDIAAADNLNMNA